MLAVVALSLSMGVPVQDRAVPNLPAIWGKSPEHVVKVLGKPDSTRKLDMVMHRGAMGIQRGKWVPVTYLDYRNVSGYNWIRLGFYSEDNTTQRLTFVLGALTEDRGGLKVLSEFGLRASPPAKNIANSTYKPNFGEYFVLPGNEWNRNDAWLTKALPSRFFTLVRYGQVVKPAEGSGLMAKQHIINIRCWVFPPYEKDHRAGTPGAAAPKGPG